MKKLPFIFIPAIVVIVIVVAVLGYRMFVSAPASSQPAEFPNSLNSKTKNPTTSFSTPTPATAADLNNELKSTVDDGGKSDLDALTRETAGL
jgi:flagellar basal body-associated protein FliL